MFRESNGAAKMMVRVGSKVDDFISRDAAPVEILSFLYGDAHGLQSFWFY